MQTVKLGKTDMEITPIGFGSWAIGGSGWRAAWGSQDDEEAIGAAEFRLDEDEIGRIENFIQENP